MFVCRAAFDLEAECIAACTGTGAFALLASATASQQAVILET